MVFCDLVGSTALSTHVDPEELANLISQYQHACSEAIVRFDGFVARYLGDGILAYFGYPLAHEDDTERAVRAALAVVEAVGKLPPSGGRLLEVRVGIATGDDDDAPAFPFVFSPVLGFEIVRGSSFDALLGMDILKQCDLTLLRNGSGTLCFD